MLAACHAEYESRHAAATLNFTVYYVTEPSRYPDGLPSGFPMILMRFLAEFYTYGKPRMG